MKNTVLIGFLGEHNEHNFIATLHFKPHKVILIHPENLHYEEIFQECSHFLQRRLYSIMIENFHYNPYTHQKLKRIFDEYKDYEIIMNLTGIPILHATELYPTIIKNLHTFIYVDMQYKKILQYQSRKWVEIENSFDELKIQDFIYSVGGEIVTDATLQYQEEAYQGIVDLIVHHYGLWKSVKRVFRDNDLVVQFYDQPLVVHLYTEHLPDKNVSQLKRFCELLQLQGMVNKFFIQKKKIKLTFINVELKNFLMVSGTWLEALTYSIVVRMDIVNDVKYGVRFLWDHHVEQVENELDVLATTRNSLVCISCKDTSHYDVPQLNELMVYAQRLGGEEVKKILVATEAPKRKSLYKRAQEMGIQVVLYHGDTKEFGEKLYQIISSTD